MKLHLPHLHQDPERRQRKYDTTPVTFAQFQSADLPEWSFEPERMTRRYETGDYATAVPLLDAIAAHAEEVDHHPDIDLRYGHLVVMTSSHDCRAVTGRDLDLARACDALAEEILHAPAPSTGPSAPEVDVAPTPPGEAAGEVGGEAAGVLPADDPSPRLDELDQPRHEGAE